ncbi:MAG: hypothetical protein ACLFO2_00485 [Candidatus Woesearchaeota archaeon]
MKRHGVSLSFNTIIIAALGLLVLALLIYLVSDSTGNFKESTACAKKSGQCVEQGTCDSDKVIEPDGDERLCKQSGYECCGLVPQR